MTTARVRTFHARRGRLGPEMNDALDELLPRYAVAIESPGAPSDLFDPPLPVVLEIGFGMGDATVTMARLEPDRGILAVDVHTRGIAALARALDSEALTNVRVAHGDAVTLVEALPEGCLAGIRAWFPDPWPKARHHKRRLVQPVTLTLLASRLQSGGTMHFATDWPEYAEQMLEVVSAEPTLRLTSTGFTPRPEWRPMTRYEKAGLTAGRPVADLIAVRV
ncbi:MAG: tRNA (guanosine(46)-N7)-methyltransferase TrmB [Actinobacteria bacterium]|nr:tRNA (guanosine(46)-N7)-methyltransferase TrmB [Actinomycetota bacterium]